MAERIPASKALFSFPNTLRWRDAFIRYGQAGP
jgi:hypothetical protein